VTGFNLDAQIVGASTPKFQSIDFTGGIWDSHPTMVGGGPVSGSTQYAQASVIFTNSGDQTQANGLLCTLVVDTTGYAAGQSYALKLAESGIGVDSSFVLYGGAADPAAITNGSLQLSQSSVAGRYIVYNNSTWDGNGTAVSAAADNNAIATDKQALLPNQTATFANYTSYSRGVNEIMIDIANLVVTPTLANFGFTVGNTTSPSSWPSAPTPTSFNVWSGGGTSGSTRVVITWADGAIVGKWLQADVKAAGLGMAKDDVFYFGNAPGESGNSTTNAFVDGSDIAGARDHFANFLNKATITNAYDYNRDRFVDGSDMAIARDDATNFLTALKLITTPPPPSGSPASSGPAGRAVAPNKMLPGSSANPTITAGKLMTTAGLASSGKTSVFGQSVTFTATVTAADGSTPTGMVTFLDGTTPLGNAVALSGGTAKFLTSSLTPGNHTITASYAGTSSLEAASAVLMQTISPAITTTSLIASDYAAVFGELVTFTATVIGVAPATGTPTGTVTFYDGNTVLGTVAVKSSKATYNTSALTAGSHTITAVYSGDTNFIGRPRAVSRLV